jgi:polysaccharide biosynthesis protein PelA
MKRLLLMERDKIRILGVVGALGVLIALVGAGGAAADALPSIAFYYGDHPPVRQLACFDRIVVESAHISNGDLQTLQSRGGRVHAYVSVGEAEPWRNGYEDMSRSWFLGRNAAWDSDITDLSNPEYRRFLLDNRFQPLWDRGFRAFFLDTLDSYQALDPRKLDLQAQQGGLVELVRAIRQRFPAVRLIANRGFEVFDRIHGLIDGVAAESLYCAWDPLKKSYVDVAGRDRQWLTARLREARETYHLEIYAVDYLPADQREKARQVARKIADLGISPWVTVPRQDVLGVGLREFIPREVLVLYDDDTGRAEIEQMAVLLDYYGYVAVYQHTRKTLPAYRLAGRCAGLITCLHATQSTAYGHWLQQQTADGLRVLILSDPGLETDNPLFKNFGLKPVPATAPYRVVAHDALYGFETQIASTAEAVPGLQNVQETNQVHLKVEDRHGTVLTPVVTGPWGGMALSPWAYYDRPAGKPLWVMKPFELVKTALALPSIPMPDVTTENGQRVWMSHIDGDGFINRAELPGTPFAAEVIRTRILEKYRYPTTVSIIEGEIGPAGIYPQLSAEAESIARKIYRMPTVEAASHTFSHPFDWQKVQQGATATGEYSLPIKGYRYSMEREIQGSANYMEKALLPAGKRVKVLLWSGDCLPTANALVQAREAGLLNMNGGDTIIRKDEPHLFYVSPMARPVDDELQIYAPIMNENVYTNLWHGPYYGFRRVIETFELTDQPRRLKPIDIYYHFYSGEKTAALRALRTVYDWTLKQQILPLFTSEYIQRVLACRQAMVFRELSGALEYIAPAALRTLRLAGGACTLDLSTADNVAGYRRLHDGTYFALSGGTRTRLKPGTVDNRAVRLVRANGILDAWHRQADGVRVSMHGHRPLEMVVDGPGTCSIKVGGRALPAVKTGEGWRFEMDGLRLKGARIVCR